MLLTKLQCIKTTLIDSNFGTSSPSLSLSTSCLALPDNITVSGDNNSYL